MTLGQVQRDHAAGKLSEDEAVALSWKIRHGEATPEVPEADGDASAGMLVFYALCFVGVMGLAAMVVAL